jgi:nucleotide-binding universal stress UspA family protein
MTHAPQQPTVVVGVEEITGSRAAIQAAAQEARYRGASLIAVMAYSSNPALGAPAARPVGTTRTAEDERLTAEAALRDAVADALGEQASLVTPRTVAGPAGRNLVEAARAAGAQLIVLAGHGTSVLPGSVSHYVLRKAPCPVLIVPEAVQATAGTAAARDGGHR